MQYTGRDRRAPRGAHRRRALRRLPHGRDSRSPDRAPRRSSSSFTPNDVAKLAPGRAHYSALLTPEGDLRRRPAGLPHGGRASSCWSSTPRTSRATSPGSRRSRARERDALENVSDRYALLALQGPRAVAILQPLTATPLAPIKYYGFAHGDVDGRPAIVSRTGYTGEDGFELFVDAAATRRELWERLLAAGEPLGLVPAGLGARDTLRLEAGMALYGHEIDRATTPWEAGLDWIVKLDKGDFVGRDALVAARGARRAARQLVGFEVEGRGIARQGMRDLDGRQRGAAWSPAAPAARPSRRRSAWATCRSAHARPSARRSRSTCAARRSAARVARPAVLQAITLAHPEHATGAAQPSSRRRDCNVSGAITATRRSTSGCGSRTTSASSGITDFAQKELGEVVFVELPEVGHVFDAGDEIGTIESVKAVAEVFTPVAGEIVEVNEALADDPRADQRGSARRRLAGQDPLLRRRRTSTS